MSRAAASRRRARRTAIQSIVWSTSASSPTAALSASSASRATPASRSRSAFAPEPDLAHEGGAVRAALLADGASAAAVALVDGDGSPWLGPGDAKRRPVRVASASVGGGAAGVGAELLAETGVKWRWQTGQVIVTAS
jgi:hypothetical protein